VVLSAPIGPGLWPGPRPQTRWPGRFPRPSRARQLPPALSAWEVCGAVALPPAGSVTCGDLGGLSLSDRDDPRVLLPSGTQRARCARITGMSLCGASSAAASDGWHLGALVLVTASGLPAAHGCGAVKQELRLVVVLIVSLRSWTRRPAHMCSQAGNVC
jgi:hypothetical protein